MIIKHANAISWVSWAPRRFHLHVPLLVIELVLEDLAVHDVLVLVNEGTHSAWGRPLVLILNDIEVVWAVCIDTAGEDQFVELVLGHGVDVCVDVEFDLKTIHLTTRSNSRH